MAIWRRPDLSAKTQAGLGGKRLCRLNHAPKETAQFLFPWHSLHSRPQTQPRRATPLISTAEYKKLAEKNQCGQEVASGNNKDSMTEVYLQLEGPRRTCSFKANKKLWDAFNSYAKANYGSVCHLLEPIMQAILTAQVYLGRTLKAERIDEAPIVIENLHVERVVQRHRRVYREYEGVRLGNCYRRDPGAWFHEDGELNENGHVYGCECAVCKPPRKGDRPI